MTWAVYVPAPVTRATLPSREADARPRGPGTASYLLLPPLPVIPGILNVVKMEVVVVDIDMKVEMVG